MRAVGNEGQGGPGTLPKLSLGDRSTLLTMLKLSRSAEGTPAYPKPRPPHYLVLVEIPPKFVIFLYIT